MPSTPSHTAHASVLEEMRSSQSVNAQWDPVEAVPIEGAYIRDVKNVVYSRGMLTELYRSEWFADVDFTVRHVALVTLLPGQTSQWHRHHVQRDIVFPIDDFIRIGLFDPRAGSSSLGQGTVLTFHRARPRYLYIPPGVWHALRNPGTQPASYVVFNDTVFDYEQPDDWVLPVDSTLIPVKLNT